MNNFIYRIIKYFFKVKTYEIEIELVLMFVQDDGLEAVYDADDDPEDSGEDLDLVLLHEVAAVLK